MDLTQIRYFLALAQTLNFTRAAEMCNVTQPALTKSIQRLEDELGGPLLLRERSLTQLTPLGVEMLPLLEQTHTAAKRAKEHAEAMKTKTASPLRIGFAPDSPMPPFAPLFAELAARLPLFTLTVAEAASASIMEALLSGSLDVGVVTEGAILPDRMNRWALFKDLVVLLMPQDHGFDSAEPLVAAMAEGTIVIGGQLDSTATMFDLTGCPLPAPTHHTNSASRAADLVRAGLGVTWSTHWAGPAAGLDRRRVAWRNEHDVVLVVPAGRPTPRAADAFIKLARARAWDNP
jgi:LysR family hydrogen peroxide-inducible transcriptional activator